MENVQNLILERDMLSTRIAKAEKYLSEHEAPELSYELSLLSQQILIMKAYYNVLQLRIEYGITKDYPKNVCNDLPEGVTPFDAETYDLNPGKKVITRLGYPVDRVVINWSEADYPVVAKIFWPMGTCDSWVTRTDGHVFAGSIDTKDLFFDNRE